MSDSTRAPASTSEGPFRRYVDGEGRSWLVREARVPHYDRRNGIVLVFESAEVLRIVRNYPAEWMSLSVAELIALSLTI